MAEAQKRIALLCARPPEQNTGMATVDLAGQSLFASAFPNAKVELYFYGDPAWMPYPDGWVPFGYKDAWADREEFLSADCRVVWGDFMHSAALWMPVAQSWPEPAARPTREDIAGISFLLGRDDDLFARTISFGGTLITNNAGSYRDELYRRSLEGFYTQAHTALLRDAISAAVISEYRPAKRTLGIDCAFLNTPANLERLKDFAPQEAGDRVGVFFGRTPGFLKLLAFANKVGRQAQMETRWIPWFHTRRRHRVMGRAMGFPIAGDQPPPGAALSMLSGCRLVVTDTYHLAINAWRMGIPVICVGVGVGTAANSLSDKKKEILFKMYGADGLYVFAEALATGAGRSREAARALALALDPEFTDRIKGRIEQHRSIARSALLAAVADILA